MGFSWVMICDEVYIHLGIWTNWLFTSALSSLHLLAGTLLFRFSCFPHMPAHCGLLAELAGVPPCCSIPLVGGVWLMVAWDDSSAEPQLGPKTHFGMSPVFSPWSFRSRNLRELWRLGLGFGPSHCENIRLGLGWKVGINQLTFCHE